MAIVKKYKAEVISFVNHFDNIYTVELASKSGNFKYLPGQFLHFALDEYDPSSNWPESRCFSMQTSPSSHTIKITFSAKGNFTTRMANELCIGKTVDIKLPFGELFQQDHNKESVVSKTFETSGRNYHVLEEQHFLSAVGYQVKIRNSDLNMISF